MARMTGGEAIVDSLLRHGIDTVFGLPGVQTYGLFDAFARASNRLRLINARHEQATAYMALGYACATGRPAAYAVVPRPGRAQHHRRAGHRLGGERAGAVPHRTGPQRDDRPRPRPVPRASRPARHFAKPAEMGRTDRTSDPGPHLVARAFQEMQSGRPGPVALEMPLDQFSASAEVTPQDPLPLYPNAAVRPGAESRRWRNC